MSGIVSCYSGGCYAEQPRAFIWQGVQLDIVSVIEAARLPESKYFLVQTNEDQYFRLEYNFLTDGWQVELI